MKEISDVCVIKVALPLESGFVFGEDSKFATEILRSNTTTPG
jgi:hypothetical protein